MDLITGLDGDIIMSHMHQEEKKAFSHNHAQIWLERQRRSNWLHTEMGDTVAGGTPGVTLGWGWGGLEFLLVS